MTSLFYPPKFASLIPGSKLTFTITGTTTPQNTYTDESLLVASSNPVVADAFGVFAPIYLDPTLPSYRVKWTTAANVLIYQTDNYPSSQSTTTNQRIVSTSPSVLLFDTDGTSNQRKYRLRVASDRLLLEAGNDAESVFTTIASFVGASGTILENGATIKDGFGTAFPIADRGIDSFTGTLTGLTTSPTTVVRYRRSGDLVTLDWQAQSATSNTTALTITGAPTAVTPVSARSGLVTRVIDNGTTQFGLVSVGATGVLTFSVGATAAAFTNSGTKGVPVGSVTYSLL